MGVSRRSGRTFRRAAAGPSVQLCPPRSSRAVLAGCLASEKLCSYGLGSTPIHHRSLTELNVRVLRALEPSQYRTIDAIRELVAVPRFVARAELTRLREQELAEDNGEHPLAFRRTVLGDEALKWFG